MEVESIGTGQLGHQDKKAAGAFHQSPTPHPHQSLVNEALREGGRRYGVTKGCKETFGKCG